MKDWWIIAGGFIPDLWMTRARFLDHDAGFLKVWCKIWKLSAKGVGKLVKDFFMQLLWMICTQYDEQGNDLDHRGDCTSSTCLVPLSTSHSGTSSPAGLWIPKNTMSPFLPKHKVQSLFISPHVVFNSFDGSRWLMAQEMIDMLSSPSMSVLKMLTSQTHVSFKLTNRSIQKATSTRKKSPLTSWNPPRQDSE